MLRSFTITVAPQGRPTEPLPRDADGFGALLRRYRERAELSIKVLAHAALVDPSYVTRLEHGDREPPRREVVLRLATALGLRGSDADRLLILGGYAPPWLMALARQARVMPPREAAS